MVQLIQIVLVTFCFITLRPGNANAIDGNKWKTFPELSRSAYIMGVVDTWSNVAEATAEVTKIKRSYKTGIVEDTLIDNVQCVAQKMTYKQIVAIVDKYMADNPSQWHFTMPSLIWTAVAEACGTLK
jgi:hypothetical protein